MKLKKNKKGFTLTEILIVIVIIGIVLAISIPSIIAIRKRINERLLENKKDIILVAAELYGQDNAIYTDTIIHVYDLINEKYIEPDIKQNNSNCSGEYTENGCVINPVDDSSLNNERILIKREGKSVIAIWDGEIGSTTSKELVDAVKDKLNCDEITESKPCLFTGKNPDNYLYYSGIMWRIIGIYKIDGKETIKMITDDTILTDNA